MTNMMVDNQRYRKIKWIELGICIILLFGGGFLTTNEMNRNDDVTELMMIGIMMCFIGVGMSMSWMIAMFYFKKVSKQ